MKSISKYISSALMIAAVGCSFTACDDWTEPESIDLEYGTIDKADPAAYDKYLANLREYRSLAHKKVYTWFNNAETAFGSQGHRISALPDSVDVVVIANPEKVTNQMIQEMYDARTNKGQQFSFCVDYNEIKAAYTALCEELAAKRIAYTNENGEEAVIPNELQDPDFIEYIAESATKKLAYFDAVGFDCIMAGFDGKATNHLTAAELAEYKAQTNAFLGIIADWAARHADVKVDILGRPQYIDSALLEKVRYIFLSESANATNANEYQFFYLMTGEVVPLNRCGMIASLPDVTGTNPDLGYYATGELAVNGLAAWSARYDVAAVGTLNTGDDYFITDGKYTNVRQLIQAVNPSVK